MNSLYFIGFWTNPDTWSVLEFSTRKDALKFIIKYISSGETVPIYSDPKLKRLYGNVRESNGSYIFVPESIKGKNRLHIIKKDGTVRMV